MFSRCLVRNLENLEKAATKHSARLGIDGAYNGFHNTVECGVQSFFISQGLPEPRTDECELAPHFCRVIKGNWGVPGKPVIMKKDPYITPKQRVIAIQPEQFICTSGDIISPDKPEGWVFIDETMDFSGVMMLF